MTERYTYALKTIMLLYDALFVSCQGDFVTSFGEHSAISGQQKTPTLTVVPAEAGIYQTNLGKITGTQQKELDIFVFVSLSAEPEY